MRSSSEGNSALMMLHAAIGKGYRALDKISLNVADTNYRLVPKFRSMPWTSISECSELKVLALNAEYASLHRHDKSAWFFVDQDVICSWTLLMDPEPRVLQYYLLTFERNYLTYPILHRILRLHITSESDRAEYTFFHEMAKSLNVIKGVYSAKQLVEWCNEIDAAFARKEELPQLK